MNRPALELLAEGALEILGLIPYSSNYTFLARVGEESDETFAVYKPTRGERPLWDFPTGTLAAREVAAYLVSEAAGWKFVPPTVVRDDAPLGLGSVQLFIEHDPERHFFVMEDERRDEFKAFAVFDAVINNADRKGGHVLEGKDGKLWAIDHGVCFHVEPKLRTVIWKFATHPLPDDLVDSLTRLRAELTGGLGDELAQLLSDEESEATLARTEGLLRDGTFPAPQSDRPLPWPLV